MTPHTPIDQDLLDAQQYTLPDNATPQRPPNQQPQLIQLPQGCAANRPQDNSQSVGPRGPLLAQDGMLHEMLAGFVFQDPIPRPLHTKGYGALGSFRPYQSMAPYTKAAFLQDPNTDTPVLVRFSQAGSRQGTPDTTRDIRGFATKFYTPEGIFDLVGNHIPVFFVRDPMLFPETLAALRPDQKTNLPTPQNFWSYVARRPETLHALTWLYSDAGTPASYRRMRGFGVNTYVWRNSQNVRKYIKYHWLPFAGEAFFDNNQAQILAGEQPFFLGQDLHNALANGNQVEYQLAVQVMNPADVEALNFDPLDDTKIWDETRYPLLPVGKMTLTANPEDYKAQVEEVVFSPNNLVPGIEFSDDKMLQGRSFVYWDSQRRRLGAGFRDIPVNHQPGWTPQGSMSGSGEGVYIQGEQIRAAIPQPDNFTQAGQRYAALPTLQQRHLTDNVAAELAQVTPEVQTCVLGYFRQASPDFAQNVTQRITMLNQQRTQ